MLIRFEPEEINFDNNEITRLLSQGRKNKGLSTSMLKELELMKNEARLLIEPMAVYAYFNTVNLPKSPCFEESEKVALAICTIGHSLPNKVKKLMKEGYLSRGVILDAIGSACAEFVAELVNKRVNQEAKDLSLQYSERYSPGYCEWALSNQKLFFNLLPAEEINVKLTESYLMIPVKSVSFAINLGAHIAESRWENRCNYCENEDCSYRRW
ncbi:MAG: vitamin B12 dependent-methionine synthase activation domain-containing protein [Candidatus Hodarchaeota archaeon]